MLNSTIGKKQKSTPASYLARPRLGTLKNFRTNLTHGLEKKKKPKKPPFSTHQGMDFRRRPDYADTAYKEALSRLRMFLTDSYPPKRPIKEILDSGGEETDNQSLISGISRNSRPSHIHYRYSPSISKKYLNLYYTPTKSTFQGTTPRSDRKTLQIDPKWSTNQNPQVTAFIERQEEYIEQLERESRFCRDELTQLLRKVKDVIWENENLHEKQKSSLLKSVFNRIETETETETENESSTVKAPKKQKFQQLLQGPTIVFESRISELEAQLTQTKIDLRKAIEENDSFRRKIAEGTLADSVGLEGFKKQMEILQREKTVSQETITKLQSALAQLRDKDNLISDQVKRSLDAAEQAQYEKNAAELEIRRLKDELERQHEKIRSTINDQAKRIAEERSSIERRYSQQIEQLTNELGVQWETSSKLQLEVDKQRRENSDLRREISQKQAYIDELKKEMQSKIINLQSDIGLNGAEKSALEQQISTLQLANERNDRQARQEAARLQAEMQSLRQRLDRSDADLIHSRRENIRLSEQIASLEKEINLNAVLSEEKNKRSGNQEVIALPAPTTKKDDREKELSSMIKEMESKHAATVAELEGMVQSQNQLMDKLTNECQTLTTKLDEASTRHKEEIRELQNNLEYLTNRVNSHNNYNHLASYADEGHAPLASRRNSKLLSRTNSFTALNPGTSPTSDNRRQSIVIPEGVTLSRRSSIVYQHPQEQYVDTGYQYTADPNQEYGEPYGYEHPQYVTQEEYDQQNQIEQPQYITQEEYDRQYGQYQQEDYLGQYPDPNYYPQGEIPSAELQEVEKTESLDKVESEPNTKSTVDKKDDQEQEETVKEENVEKILEGDQNFNQSSN